MTDDRPERTEEAPIDEAVRDRVADETGSVDDEKLTTALVELNAVLIGEHSRLERAGDYVTADGVRAYRVPDDEWESIVEEFDFEDDVETAVRRTHTEQARLMFASVADAHEGFADDECGVVIGIDTAEEF